MNVSADLVDLCVRCGSPSTTSADVPGPMGDCTLYLDDEPVLVDGPIVVDEMRVARGAAARP